LTSFQHAEFGEVTLRRSARVRRISIHFNPKGNLIVSAPRLMPVFLIKKTIEQSLSEIRKLQSKQPKSTTYNDNELIGHKRTLHFQAADIYKTTITDTSITITYPRELSSTHTKVQDYVSEKIANILRRDAKLYLSSRLQILADRYGYSYQRIRFSNASTRWGSCSSSGTISLNIALMRLPLDLIDYVLIHELCHTKSMNHSKAFWNSVEAILPNYRSLRSRIKHFTTAL
jgi:predicted metal-dependent hydrolase